MDNLLGQLFLADLEFWNSDLKLFIRFKRQVLHRGGCSELLGWADSGICKEELPESLQVGALL